MKGFCVKKEKKLQRWCQTERVVNNNSVGLKSCVMSAWSGTSTVRLRPLWWRRVDSVAHLGWNQIKGGGQPPLVQWECQLCHTWQTLQQPALAGRGPHSGSDFFQSWPKWKHLVLIRDSGCDSCSGSCEDLAVGPRRGAVALVQNTQIFPR